MNTRHISLAGMLVLALLASSALAAPAWTLRTDLGGDPLVLAGLTGGFSGGLVNATRIAATLDGYVVAYDQNGSASGHEMHVLSPAKESPNSAVANATVALDQFWTTTQDLWEASTTSNEQITGDTSYGVNGITRATSANTHFSWQGGGTAAVKEWQLQDDDGDYNALNEKMARLATFNAVVDTGQHKGDLEMVASAGADTWQILGAVAGMAYVRKMEFGALTGLVIDPGSTANNTAGTRTVTNGGRLVDGGGSATAWLADLVPGINDTVRGMALNPADGWLYFISHDTTTSQVYLSAVSFQWGALADNSVVTIEDLNPGAGENYIALTYDSGDANDDLLLGYDIAFAPDGSRLFVRTDPSSDRIWQFDVVPEPATVGLLALGFLPLARRRRGK